MERARSGWASHGRDVKRLQGYLGSAGHRVTRDGEFGPRTLRALRATERELELRADGVATTREQRAIRLRSGWPARAARPTRRRLRREQVVPGEDGKVNGDGFAVPPRSAPKVGEGRDRGRQRDREDARTSGAAAIGAGTTPATTARAPSRSPCTARACSTARSSQATSPAGATAARASWITDLRERRATSTWSWPACASTRAPARAPARAGRWSSGPSDGFAVTHPAGL